MLYRLKGYDVMAEVFKVSLLSGFDYTKVKTNMILVVKKVV